MLSFDSEPSHWRHTNQSWRY